jgi:hypothetical protein
MQPFHVRAFSILLLLTSACQTSRYYDARYVKMPIEQEVHADAVPGSQVRALVTILGVARPDPPSGQQKQVEIRMRFENLGTIPATLIESSLSLLSADLIPFGPARLAPNNDLIVPPGQARQFDVAFPAPPNEVDWTALNLRFGLQFENTPVVTGATFTRLTYYPTYDPYWHVGVGYGYCW